MVCVCVCVVRVRVCVRVCVRRLLHTLQNGTVQQHVHTPLGLPVGVFEETDPILAVSGTPVSPCPTKVTGEEQTESTEYILTVVGVVCFTCLCPWGDGVRGDPNDMGGG